MDAILPKLKIDDLAINKTYDVLKYKPCSSVYGDTFILRCKLFGSEEEEFEMYATLKCNN